VYAGYPTGAVGPEALSHFLVVFIAILSLQSVLWDSKAKRKRSTPMLDAVFVLVTVAFFIVSIGYVAGCDRLK
jgi:uncharacterized membrane protein YwzB